jgi:hypothetical protein
MTASVLVHQLHHVSRKWSALFEIPVPKKCPGTASYNFEPPRREALYCIFNTYLSFNTYDVLKTFF